MGEILDLSAYNRTLMQIGSNSGCESTEGQSERTVYEELKAVLFHHKSKWGGL